MKAHSSVELDSQLTSLSRRLATGVGWTVAGLVASRALVLASAVLVGRMLGARQFGELGMFQSTVDGFAALAGFGLGLTGTKFVAELRQRDPVRAGRIAALSLMAAAVSGAALAIALFAAAPWLATHTMAAPHLSPFLRIGSICLMANAVTGAAAGVLMGLEAFRRMAVIGVAIALVTLPASVVGAFAWGFAGAVGATVLISALTLFAYLAVLYREAARAGIGLHLRNAATEMRVLLSFSVPAVLAAVMVPPVMWAAGALLVNQANGYVEMGTFSAADQWRRALQFIPATLGSIAFPILANLHGNFEERGFWRVFSYNIVANGTIALVAAAAMVLGAGLLVRAYGVGFSGLRWVLILLAVSTIFYAVGSAVGHALVTRGDIWPAFGLNVVWALVLLCCAWFWIPSTGARGLALANVVAYGVLLCSQVVLLWTRHAPRPSSSPDVSP